MLPSPTPDALGAAVLAALGHNFRQYKALADRALAQLRDAEWAHVPAPGSNSAAVIVQHMAGNLRSRFTDFRTTDGEKPTRRRDQEFEEPAGPAAVPALRQEWEAAWAVLFALLDDLRPDELLHPVTIRGEAYTVLGALQRQSAHHPYHVGQLVQLAKLVRGGAFRSLSIPRGQSEQFTAHLRAAANPAGPLAV